MSLTVKSLQVLIDLKAALLSRELPAESVTIVADPSPRKKQRKEEKGPVMRHARIRGRGYQRYKQRHDW